MLAYWCWSYAAAWQWHGKEFRYINICDGCVAIVCPSFWRELCTIVYQIELYIVWCCASNSEIYILRHIAHNFGFPKHDIAQINISKCWINSSARTININQLIKVGSAPFSQILTDSESAAIKWHTNELSSNCGLLPSMPEGEKYLYSCSVKKCFIRTFQAISECSIQLEIECTKAQ